MIQLEIPLSRTTDPLTSQSAATKAESFKARDISKIWNALRDFGPMNKNEIAKVTGLDHVAVCRRFAEMKRNGLIFDTGKVETGCRVMAVSFNYNAAQSAMDSLP